MAKLLVLLYPSAGPVGYKPWHGETATGGGDTAGSVLQGRQLTVETAVRWYQSATAISSSCCEVDHTAIFRWTQVHAAELEKQIRSHLHI